MQFEMVLENGEFALVPVAPLKPFVTIHGEFFPSIWDRSAESAIWFIENGQMESAKYVIRNMADEIHEKGVRNSDLRFDVTALREENRTLRNKEIESRMVAKDLYKDLSNAIADKDLMVDSFDRSQSELTETKAAHRRALKALDMADENYVRVKRELDDLKALRGFDNEIFNDVHAENKGLRKSYGKVKRAYLALKRKVKEMTDVIYQQAQTIEDLRYRIEDLERENSELSEKKCHEAYNGMEQPFSPAQFPNFLADN